MTFYLVANVTKATVVCRWTSLKRRTLIACLCVVLQLVSPPPAHAWFGWLDHLSGPGPYHGLQFEFRVACFGDESVASKISKKLAAARILAPHLTVPTSNNRSPSPQTIEAIRALLDLTTELEQAQVTFPVFNKKQTDALTPLLNGRDELLAAFNLATPARLFQPASEPGSSLDPTTKSGKSPQQSITLQDALGKVDSYIDVANVANTSLQSTGVFWSLCSNEKTRRLSLDLGITFWRTIEDSSNFANGQPIRLETLMPSISWRVFSNPQFDVLDAGIGGGVYWFSSAGFEAFKGIVLQPGRLDFHVPTRWSTFDIKGTSDSQLLKTLKTLARVAAIVNVRYAVMSFPSGFAANAFAGIGVHGDPIRAELNQSWSIFLNLKPFAHRTRPPT